MDIEAARSKLVHALTIVSPSGSRFRAAHEVLIEFGAEALGVARQPGLSLDGLLKAATDLPPSDARGIFAIVLVHALGVPGLLPAQGRFAGDLQSFLERALLNPLRRAGYRFDGTRYEKQQFLIGLHLTIDDHLQPPEPSIPRWIHGLGHPDTV